MLEMGDAEEQAARDRDLGLKGGGGGLFGGPAVVEKSPYASPLANVSAALLGSLTKLKHRPSKTPLGTLMTSVMASDGL
jgi:hypothetical protein